MQRKSISHALGRLLFQQEERGEGERQTDRQTSKQREGKKENNESQRRGELGALVQPQGETGRQFLKKIKNSISA